MEKLEPLDCVGGNEKQYSHCGKLFGGSSKKLNIRLPFNPTIPLPGIYPKELKIGTQILAHQCPPQNYSQKSKGGHSPSAQLTEEWINNVACKSGILFSHKKKTFHTCYKMDKP